MNMNQKRAFKQAVHKTLRFLKSNMQEQFAMGNYAKADELQKEFFELRRYVISHKL